MKTFETVANVNLDRFMGKWYVIAGRFTFVEKGAHNAIEIYTYNQKKQRIDIAFTFRKDSFNGKLKSLPQKAWIINKKTNAHWKVRPFWPLKFDYLVLALDPNYQWVAIGVPSQKYLWIMARTPHFSEVDQVLSQLVTKGYDISRLVEVPHQ